MIARWFAFVAIGTLWFVASAKADDWPQWGGPERDLVWRDEGIVDHLPSVDPATGVLPRVWTAKIGAGYAGPAVADGRVFVTDRIADENLERVLCFDATTGKEVWKHEYEARYTISYPLGPRATPTVDGDRVYVLGAMGNLFCFDAPTGKIVWQKHLPSDFGTELPAWGMAAPPLVDGDQVIILAGGKPSAMVVSLDKHSGEEKWRALDGKEPGYCPPVIFNYGGRRQLIVWHPAAVVSLDPAKGNVLWEVPFAVEAALTISTPRQLGNRLFVTSFYNGPLMIDLGDDGVSPQVLWRSAANNNERKNNSLHAIMCTPIVTEDCIYGVGSYGEMRCLDTKTGELLWETHDATGPGRWWNAFLIPHGDRVVICNEQGDLIFATLSRAGYKELSRAKMIEPTQPVQRRMTVWSHPAFAMQSVFARNDGELIRVDLSKKLAARSSDWRKLSPPIVEGNWVRPAADQPARPIWGHARGLRVGLDPMPGPRGLLRIYAPSLGQPDGRAINYIAVEPIVGGENERGLSELEYSKLDRRRGKRFRSVDTINDRAALLPTRPALGRIVQVDGIDTLRVFILVEPFDNGAHVYLRLSFRADRPDEVGIAVFAHDDSDPLSYCVLTATMGNFARLRQLHLAERTVEAGDMWPEYRDDGFTPHARFALDELSRTAEGHALAAATPNELNPRDATFAPGTRSHWHYDGELATQSWRSESPDPQLEVLVNGRFAYWNSDSPIPGGISFENFEMVEPFRQGAEFWFGVRPRLSSATDRTPN